jgi:DNA-binding XRE family transcriptional regulator
MTSNQRNSAKLTFYVFAWNRNPRMALPWWRRNPWRCNRIRFVTELDGWGVEVEIETIPAVEAEKLNKQWQTNLFRIFAWNRNPRMALPWWIRNPWRCNRIRFVEELDEWGVEVESETIQAVEAEQLNKQWQTNLFRIFAWNRNLRMAFPWWIRNPWRCNRIPFVEELLDGWGVEVKIRRIQAVEAEMWQTNLFRIFASKSENENGFF